MFAQFYKKCLLSTKKCDKDFLFMKLWNRFHFVKLTLSNSDNESSSKSILAEFSSFSRFIFFGVTISKQLKTSFS